MNLCLSLKMFSSPPLLNRKKLFLWVILTAFFLPYITSSDKTKKLKSLLQNMNFSQLIKDPTRVTLNSKSLIDIIASRQPQNISEAKVIKSSFSDHDIVCCVRKLISLKFKPRTIRCRNYGRYSPLKFNEDLSSLS